MSDKKTPKPWASTASFHGEYWVKCPHCHKSFETHSTAFKSVKDGNGEYVKHCGKVVIACPECGGYIC